MNFIEELTEEALCDGYLIYLITKIEKSYGEFLFNSICSSSIDDKEFYDLMRFTDILSRSNNSKAKNLVLKIIALCNELPNIKENPDFKTFASSALIKMGNFPSLNIVNPEGEMNDEIIVDKVIKEVFQESPKEGYIFTDAQYKLFENLKDSNHYSFSGSTSFGKSFVIESFIKYIIDTKNSSENMAIVVPTKALIHQVTLKLKNELGNDSYEIISYPQIPLLYKKRDKRYIFVFTPERLISYFAEVSNPSIGYLFVDEAQKLLNDDTRAPLLYHSIAQAKRKSVNIYFASPNIPNVEDFLKLFGSSQEESMAIGEKSVTQNKFFIDSFNKKSIMLLEDQTEYALEGLNYFKTEDANIREILIKLGGSHQNIVYCNTVNYTLKFSVNFAQSLPDLNNGKLEKLIKIVSTSIHKEYYLIDCLRKGVAYHFGNLPQTIREGIEELFKEGVIKYLFCTSTLLEGVNLPAKNIFIFSEKIGLRKMDDIDFWNLSGRAGRLTIDLSGNIFCCHIVDKKGYWKDSDFAILKKRTIERKTPILLKNNNQNLYKNINNILNNAPLTNKNLTDSEKKILEMYSNILLYQDIVESSSILKDKFIEKIGDNGRKTLKKKRSELEVPEKIIEQSININLDSQNKILTSSATAFPNSFDYDACFEILKILCQKYDWLYFESGGNRPLLKKESQLKYLAALMSNWINGISLNQIINYMTNYYHNKGNSRELEIENNLYIPFDKFNREHINALINQIIGDINTKIQFKIKNYITNYTLLLVEKGIEIDSEWSNYLEYGTIDRQVVELQNLGFSRATSLLLKEEFIDQFVFNEIGEIVEIKEEELKNSLDSERFSEELHEISKILRWEK